MSPLRRKPKTLTEEPTVFSMGSGKGGSVLQSLGRGPQAQAPKRMPGAATDFGTGDVGTVVAPEFYDNPGDDAVRVRARQIAARLSVRRPPHGVSRHRGSGDLVSVRYNGGSDDIDLDATLDVLTEHPLPADEHIIVRERVRTRRSVVLVVDVSGSMRGERIQTAAATVGALAGELDRDDVAVIAFWSDAAVLVRMGAPFTSSGVLESLLRLPAQGLTNVAFPLQLAAVELARRPALDARVVLLSDCVHNAGPDPRGPAARLPRLDVLLDASGEKDVELGRELASIGRGHLRIVTTHRDVAPALSRIFTS